MRYSRGNHNVPIRTSAIDQLTRYHQTDGCLHKFKQQTAEESNPSIHSRALRVQFPKLPIMTNVAGYKGSNISCWILGAVPWVEVHQPNSNSVWYDSCATPGWGALYCTARVSSSFRGQPEPGYKWSVFRFGYTSRYSLMSANQVTLNDCSDFSLKLYPNSPS